MAITGTSTTSRNTMVVVPNNKMTGFRARVQDVPATTTRHKVPAIALNSLVRPP